MSNSNLQIFIVEKNPYHQSERWYEKLKKEDIIQLKESEYYLLENRFNFWELINEELSEESGYMGGPTLYEDTWIKDSDELFRVKQKINSIMDGLSSKKEMTLINSIFNLVSRALENKYWLVFDF